MSRIIMLIPLDQDVGLTSVSLSIMHFFNKNKFKKKSSKSILYFSFRKNSLDDTSFIIKKYYSSIIDVFDNIDFSKISLASQEYFSLLNTVIEECYNKKFLYELIFVEGVNSNYSFDFEQINYDIAQNLSAEVIFLSNLKSDSSEDIIKKEKIITTFLKRKNYKNVLGLIFNKINSPFIEKKYNFIKKLTILKKNKGNKKEKNIKKTIFKNDFFSVIACIPWNQKIINVNVLDIYNFLKIKCLNIVQKKYHILDEIVVFDESYLNMLKKNYLNTLIIISFSRIDFFIKIFNLNCFDKIRGIILTGAFKSKKYIISLCNVFINKCIPVFFTEKSTIELLSTLQNFNYKINLKDKIYIQKLQKYISSFFCYSSDIFLKKNKNYELGFSPKEFCCHLKFLSRKKNKRIILPESYESRILEAASICYDHNIAECVLLGDPKKIYSIVDNKGIKLNKNIEIINPTLIRENYISRLIEIRRKKGMDEFLAKKKLEENIVLATLILESNKVDGLVSGSVNTTSDTIRPALQIIKKNPNNLLVSSIFFMLLPNKVLIYGDCAINVDPTAEELAEIAIQSAESSRIFGIEPRIAMLSYSTGYSGSGCQVEKVRSATSIVKKRRPDLIIDGPIQYDAAVSKTVSKLKAPNSSISGMANIFIFPDLNSANIAYKAVQRTSNIISIGPMLQGLRKPVNDLSRGASVEDIIYTIALTAIQCI